VSAWPELVSAALLGTERREPAAEAPIAIERTSAEERLLARAAVVAVYRRAGARARAGLGPLAPARSETLPRCSQAAALRLAGILAGEYPGVLAEWLELARARSVRVPEDLLPALLTAARGRRDVVAVAGERGAWLARLDEAWRWAAPQADVWETGSLEERRAWLAAERAADPARARAALADTWPAEDGRARAALLAVLAEGLSAADEPFLEAALGDRRREVRATAAELLARLPRSRLARRMAPRAGPLLRVARGPRPRLAVELPDALDETAARDIVEVRPPRGVGERAWWLRQMIAATPLGVWRRRLRRSPEELVALPVEGGLGDAVHAGWSHAAARQHDPGWAAALLPRTWDVRLVDALAPDVAERHVAAALDDPRARAALARLRRPWGLALSRELVRRGPLTREAALALDPRVVDELPDGAPPGVVRLLAFRRHMRAELA
jgi:hypothetical protein